ncbi:MAG: hypothetical protein ACYTF8_17330, partial [Planctomycetota bacterium]
GKQAEPKKADPQTAERAQARRAQLDELRNKKSGLTATVNGLRDTLRALDKKHAEETKGLADPRQLRPFLMRLRQDSATASGRLHTMERQYEELKQTVAKTKVSAELKQLQDKLKAVEERYWEAHSGWVASREEAKFSPIEESPVKIINDAFRAWMNEHAERKQVVAKVLAKDPTGYDFTSLDFFLRLSVRELKLDKLNIVEEKKVLDESKKKLEAIEKEMDELRDQVAGKLSEGGGDLERYQDLGSRMDEQRKKAADLERQAEEYQQIFADIEATKERHLEEQDEAARALETAEKELREVDKELRRLQRLGR